MCRLQERRGPNSAPGVSLRLSHHFRHVRFWVCDASQRCSLDGSSRWVELLRTHLLPAIIDFDSLFMYPPPTQSLTLGPCTNGLDLTCVALCIDSRYAQLASSHTIL